MTGKQKRRSRFRYSTKKALERSRLLKKTTKGRVLEFTSVTKALTYPSALWSDIGVVTLEIAQLDHGPAFLHSVDENVEERIDVSIGFVDAVIECFKKVSILRNIIH